MAVPEHADVWWCESPSFGRRPVVILSRAAAVRALGRAVVAPCTTTFRGLPSEVELDPAHDPVPRPCVVNLDSVESVTVGILVERLGRLGGERISLLCRALAVAVDCPTVP
jgi:mRNA interferase MazF